MAADRGPVPSPSQVGPGSGPPPLPQPISAEMEKALNASTCDNLLPPEQRNQVLQLILPKKKVLQLQEILRQ
ncbi:unnamed protein product [Brassica napus]|uniref:(rape) hypothetical protein n=1 Tax=Brassica napus TaxID=3708 RepID=A0A816WXR5_BRANA|nr:unnamed protein product [Brassica napus]